MLHPQQPISIARLSRVVGMNANTLYEWAQVSSLPSRKVHPRLRETTLKDFCLWLRVNRAHMHGAHLPADVRSRLMSLADSFGGAA